MTMNLNRFFQINGTDYFDDVKKEFPDLQLQAKNKKFYCDGEAFGYAKRLTEAQDLKSAVFEDVKTIIFDEYGIERSRRQYLQNEAMIFASILDSVIRNRSDIRIFILSNATEGIEFSPLFSFFDLSIPYDKDIKLFKNNTILVQYMKNEAFREERKNTLIGKIFEGTKYDSFAFQNQIQNRTSDFIEKKSGNPKFVFAIIYKGNTFGIWNDYKQRKSFCIPRCTT